MDKTREIAIRLAENAAVYLDDNGWRRDGNTQGSERCIMTALREIIRRENPGLYYLSEAASTPYRPAAVLVVNQLTDLIIPRSLAQEFSPMRIPGLSRT